jgi:hypothetical protein
MNLLSKQKTHLSKLLTLNRRRCETIGGGLYSLMLVSANLFAKNHRFFDKNHVNTHHINKRLTMDLYAPSNLVNNL